MTESPSPSSHRHIRVVVVDDQTLVRQGIEGLLALADDIEVAATAGDGDEALQVLEKVEADVLLLDLRMPKRDGIETLAEMERKGLEIPTLVLTTFEDDELALAALRGGARGYLLKDVTLEQLVGAIRTLAEGGTHLQPALTDRLLRAVTDRRSEVSGLDQPLPLTDRETEILRLMAGGYSNKEIADALYLAVGTVKNHVSNVLLKLGVRDRTRAVLRALDLGVLGDDTAPSS